MLSAASRVTVQSNAAGSIQPELSFGIITDKWIWLCYTELSAPHELPVRGFQRGALSVHTVMCWCNKQRTLDLRPPHKMVLSLRAAERMKDENSVLCIKGSIKRNCYLLQEKKTLRV